MIGILTSGIFICNNDQEVNKITLGIWKILIIISQNVRKNLNKILIFSHLHYCL